jgi:glycosyltransferase involved in cell wall biosynthesis
VLFRGLFKSLIARIENSIVSKIDGVITVNEILVDRFQKYNERVLFLPNYPRIALFKSLSRKRAVLSSHQVKLIYAGAISVNRGMLRMLDVINQLDSNLNAKLIVMGKFATPDSEKLFYKTVAAQSLHKKVVYKGNLPWEEAVQNLLEADIGLFLVSNEKRYFWGEPVKYFEYSAAGLPVIITDLPAKRKLINKNKNGLLVSPHNVHDAIKAIEYLIKHPKDARHMSESGKNKIYQEYSWESLEQKLKDFYAKMH